MSWVRLCRLLFRIGTALSAMRLVVRFSIQVRQPRIQFFRNGLPICFFLPSALFLKMFHTTFPFIRLPIIATRPDSVLRRPFFSREILLLPEPSFGNA